MPLWGWLTLVILSTALTFAVSVIFWLLHNDPYRVWLNHCDTTHPDDRND